MLAGDLRVADFAVERFGATGLLFAVLFVGDDAAGVCATPVDPNPPEPRAVNVSAVAATSRACVTGASTI